MTCVVNMQGKLLGIYTDGDIRRTLTKEFDINETKLSTVISHNCHTIKKGMLAAEALAIMQKYSITSLVAIDDRDAPIAVVHIHDLLRAGIF